MKLDLGRIAATFSFLALTLLVAGPAQAQFGRTWVSGTGADTNNCDRATPCQTFVGAFQKTVVNGEINCLDPGGFGQINITKSITIDCHDAFASIQHNLAGGMTISFDSFAGGDTQRTVRLRNINLNGLGGGVYGIRIVGANTAGSTVIIEDCLIDGNFTGLARGISDERSGGGKLIITNTTIRNLGGGAFSAFPASGSTNIQVLLNNVRAYHAGTGAQFGAGTRVMIDQSTFDGNIGGGVRAETGAIVNVDRSTISHNADGVAAAGGSVTLSNTNIAFNTASGIAVSAGGIVQSFGNNRISNNASPGTIPFLIGSTTNPTGQQ